MRELDIEGYNFIFDITTLLQKSGMNCPKNYLNLSIKTEHVAAGARQYMSDFCLKLVYSSISGIRHYKYICILFQP